MNSMNLCKSLDNIGTFIKEKMDEWKVPGMALAVVKDGEVILSKGYGLRDIKEGKEVTEDTVFGIASVTKSFTATAAGILIDEGKLDWDTQIKDYIPWFKMYDYVASERVTLRDMLCHRTGLPRYELVRYKTPFSRKEIVERLRYLPPSRDFRTVFQYQNLMYVTVGYLIEVITGKTWEEFVKNRIFDRIGMKNSNFSIEESQQLCDHSRPYTSYNGETNENPFWTYGALGAVKPCGAINSNIRDMCKWLMLNLNKGKHEDKQIISQTSISMLHTPQIICQSAPSKLKELQLCSYGMGWFIESFRGHKMVHHGGNIPGFSSLVSFMPDDNIGIVMLTNMNESYLPTIMQYDIYDRLLGYEGKDWSGDTKAQLEKLKEEAVKISNMKKRAYKEGTKPSHPLVEYTGIFENPAFGVITISIEGENLVFNYNSIDLVLKHCHYDIFQIDLPVMGAFLITFITNKNGEIDGITIPMEPDPAIKDFEFKKVK